MKFTFVSNANTNPIIKTESQDQDKGPCKSETLQKSWRKRWVFQFISKANNMEAVLIINNSQNPVAQLHQWKWTTVTHSNKLLLINKSLLEFLASY